MFEIEYEFKENDLVHFNEMLYMKNEDIQKNITKTRWIVPGLMGLIGAFYYFYYHDINTSIYIIIIATLWAILSPKIMRLDFHRQILKSYTDKEKKAMFGTYTLTIDPTNPNFLLEKSPSGKNKMAFADLVRVEYGKRYVYIFITLDTALVIPVDAVSQGNLETFAEQVDQMIQRAA